MCYVLYVCAYLCTWVHVISLVYHFSEMILRKLDTECATLTERVRETQRKT